MRSRDARYPDNHGVERVCIDFRAKPFSQLTQRDGHDSSVDGSFALRAGLPAAMHPKPLIRVLANVVLDHLREQGGMGKDIGLRIFVGWQVEGGAEAQYVLLRCLF